LPVVSIKPEKRNKVKRLCIGKSPWKIKINRYLRNANEKIFLIRKYNFRILFVKYLAITNLLVFNFYKFHI
jgi:hypothetical protein